MGSLTVRLRRSEDHGRLPLHPDCPICGREWVAGLLPPEGLVTRRMQAAVVAGVLAASGLPPTAAVAQEGDQEVEGLAAPVLNVADPAARADLELGGDELDLPSDAALEAPAGTGPQSPAPGGDGAGEEPVADVVSSGDETQSADEAPAGAAETPAPAVPPESGAATQAPPPRPAAAGPRGPASGGVAYRRNAQRDRVAAHRYVPGAGVVSAGGRPAVHPVAAQPDRTTLAEPQVAAAARSHQVDVTRLVLAGGDGRGAARGDRFHVVQRGESLWSIARDVLGRDASVAAVAKEVHRLWTLNKARIGTGDPDLLVVGTRLVLR